MVMDLRSMNLHDTQIMAIRWVTREEAGSLTASTVAIQYYLSYCFCRDPFVRIEGH